MPVKSITYLRRRLFSIPERETRFDYRGFVGGTPATQARIEQIGQTFVAGYHCAMEETRPEPLALRLDTIDNERRGFAYEGAGMALALLDLLTPWPGHRFDAFLQGPGDAHAYMLHVGVGWALARLPKRIMPNLTRFDPLLRWLILDGYGFHQGYFQWRRFVGKQQQPKRLSVYALRAFDQGLGRSFWFVHGAEPARVAERIHAFDQTRQADLWSGIGLAATYAGGVDEGELGTLETLAGPYRANLAQGAAFAAKARARAGNTTSHTDSACRIFCSISADAAARITDDELVDLPWDGEEPTYEVWRRRIRSHFDA